MVKYLVRDAVVVRRCEEREVSVGAILEKGLDLVDRERVPVGPRGVDFTERKEEDDFAVDFDGEREALFFDFGISAGDDGAFEGCLALLGRRAEVPREKSILIPFDPGGGVLGVGWYDDEDLHSVGRISPSSVASQFLTNSKHSCCS